MITNKTKTKILHGNNNPFEKDNERQFKGLFYNDTTKGKEYYEYGAHFDYKQLYDKLIKIKEEKEKKISCSILQNKMIGNVINTQAIKKIISASTLTHKEKDNKNKKEKDNKAKKEKEKTNKSPFTIRDKPKSDLCFSRNNNKIIKGSSFNVIANNNIHFTHLNVNVNVNVIQASSSSNGKDIQKNVINDYDSTITNNINNYTKKNLSSHSHKHQYKNKPRLNLAIRRSLNDTLKQYKSKDLFETLFNKRFTTSHNNSITTHKPSQSHSNVNLSLQTHRQLNARPNSSQSHKNNIMHLTEACLSPLYNHHKNKQKQDEKDEKAHYRNLTLFNSIQKVCYYNNNNNHKSSNNPSNTHLNKLKK